MSNTSNKYMSVLQYICAQQSFHSKQTLRQFKVSNNFLTAGKDMGLFKRVGESEYAWNLNRPPLISDVHGMMVRIRAYNKTSELKPKMKGQLKIQPIKRVERTEPVPQSIIELNEKISEYPILDVAIAFLAGMVVAAFFTLIWK